MSKLKTRLDARSKTNNLIKIVQDEVVLAEVELIGDVSAVLSISTIDEAHLEKNNGWKSVRNHKSI